MSRELGYYGGQYTTKSHFGKVSDDFMMDEVQCKGNEEKLLDCPHKTEDDCGGKEGLGVICKPLGPGPGMLHLWCALSLVSCIFGVMLSCSDASLAGFIFGGASLVRLLLYNASLVHCFLDPRGILGQIWILGARQMSSAPCCHYKKVSFGRHHLMGMKSLANAPQKMKKN